MNFKMIFFSLMQLFVSAALALTPGVQQLIEFETKANAAGTRSSDVVPIPHYEIPLRLVDGDFAERLTPAVADSLVFEKDGEPYVRWIANPEDTKWFKEVEKFLTENGVDATQHFFFLGYQTASRSYIIENPSNGAQFSAKSSTDVTGGAWRDKKQPVGEAEDSRLISDFLAKQNAIKEFEHFLILDEPAILSIRSLDQSVVIRDLGDLQKGDSKFLYVPGFSVLHEETGARIALANGSTDPYKFWTEHYIRLAGLALGELAARTGLQFDSPHSQNFLVELDLNLKPTGRLVLRDMADFYLDETFISNLLPDAEAKIMIEKFSQKSNIHNYVSAGFGPLHGNKFPSWVTDKQYTSWKNVFSEAFEESMENVTGQDREQFSSKFYRSGSYFTAQYYLTQIESFKEFLRQTKLNGVATYVGLPRCRLVFR